jgi:hypothetical protein
MHYTAALDLLTTYELAVMLSFCCFSVACSACFQFDTLLALRRNGFLWLQRTIFPIFASHLPSLQSFFAVSGGS